MSQRHVQRQDRVQPHAGVLDGLRIVLAMAIVCGMASICAPVSAQETSQERPVVALVLAGGGALGFAHVGVIRILETMGIPIDIVVGTSMGATIGGFYSLDFSPARMQEVILGIDWNDMFSEQVNSSEDRFRTRIDRSRYFANVDFDGRGLKIPGSVFSGRKMLYFLDRMTLSAPTPVDFDSLPRRFRAVTADLETGERVVIGSGSLADAMRASMGIPGVFSPYKVEGRYLVDGGIIDNLPVSTARALGADLIIAVDLLGGTPFAYENYERNPVNVVSRSLEIMLRSNVKPQLLDADLVLSVDLTGYETTDFGKAAEIMLRGESTARNNFSEIEAFKAMLGTFTTGNGKIERMPAKPIQRVLVEGGTDKTRSMVSAAFSPVVGRIPDEDFLEETIAKLESEGIYESIRIKRYGEDPDSTLKVELNKRDKPGQTLQLGIGYASTYSGSTTSVTGLSAGVVFRGLTSDDSRLAFSLQILDSLGFEASFIQPILPRLFIEGQFMGRMENAIYRNDADMSYLYQTKALEFGLDIGLHPAEWVEISAGLSYEWVQHDQIPDFRAGEAIGSVPMGHVNFSLRRFDSPVFPSEGISVLLQFDQSLSGSGSSRYFRTLVTEGQIVPRLGLPVSFTGWLRAGSDFSMVADSDSAAPLYHKPDLANRQFFPGPLEFEERVGSHVAGLGTELKLRLDKVSRTVGFPSFGLLQIAAGTVMQDAADMNRLSAFISLNAAIGFGVRINSGFGACFRLGLTRGFDDDYRLFTSLDLGSFAY